MTQQRHRNTKSVKLKNTYWLSQLSSMALAGLSLWSERGKENSHKFRESAQNHIN